MLSKASTNAAFWIKYEIDVKRFTNFTKSSKLYVSCIIPLFLIDKYVFFFQIGILIRSYRMCMLINSKLENK